MVFFFSGLIGRSWAMVFLSGGYRVKIYDNQPGQASRAIAEIRSVPNWGKSVLWQHTNHFQETQENKRPNRG